MTVWQQQAGWVWLSMVLVAVTAFCPLALPSMISLKPLGLRMSLQHAVAQMSQPSKLLLLSLLLSLLLRCQDQFPRMLPATLDQCVIEMPSAASSGSKRLFF
jgi:hypothetical protein